MLTHFFFCFCTKNVKMKINHPKTYLTSIFMVKKLKLEQLTIKPKKIEKLAPFFYFFFFFNFLFIYFFFYKYMDRPGTLL